VLHVISRRSDNHLPRRRWSRQWAPDPHPQRSGPCVVRSDRALSVAHV